MRRRRKKITYEGHSIGSSDSSYHHDSDKDPDYQVGHCEVRSCGGEVHAACHRCEIFMCHQHFMNEDDSCKNHGKTKLRKKKTNKIKKSDVRKPKKILTRYDRDVRSNDEHLNERRPEDFIMEGEEREVPIEKTKRINKQKLVKKKRNAGEEYVSLKTKTIVPARKLGNRCEFANCAKFGRKCEQVSDTSRQTIFKDYYALGDLRMQREFIARHVVTTDKKRTTTAAVSRREKTNTYFLTIDGNLVNVCRKLFLSTLDISERTVRTALDKVSKTGVLEPEKRGGRMSDEVKSRDSIVRESINVHINRFPKVESHYCRASSTKQYLHSDLSVSKMHAMYAQEYSGPLPVPSIATYKRVFLENKLDFHRPKKDMCSLCITYREGNEETKAKLKLKYENHIEEKIKVREIKEDLKCKSIRDPSIAVLSFDLQQVIHLPISNENALFYKRRLANYNFTLYDIAKKGCHCFTWHEGQSKRGSNEISTAIFETLMIYDHSGVKEVNLFADGCSGQNKNSILPAMMLYTVENSVNIEKISLRFFESFHGQSEGDSVHSTISSAVKRAGNVTIPSQLIPIFRLARNPPYTVHEMQYNEFLDFKELSKNLRILKCRETTANEDLNWTNFMEIFVERNKNPTKKPYEIKFKNSHRENEYHTIELKGRSIKIKGYELRPSNKDPNKLEKDKYNDLISLCSGELAIIRLEDHKRFFVHLPHL